MSDLSTLGGRIKHAMKLRGLRPREFADRLGLASPTGISQWTNNHRAPEPERLAQIAEILGISTDWILTGNGKGPDVPVSGRGGIPEDLWPEIVNFEREMARIGATNRDLDYVGSVLRIPQTGDLLARDDDGDRHGMFGQREELGILLRALEWWVRARVGRRIKPEGWELPPSDEHVLGTKVPKAPKPLGGVKRASSSE